MSKQSAKKAFMEKLRLYTSFYFCDEDAAGIQDNYASWFEAEALRGKSEEEICAGFGKPKRIVQNLLAESGLPNGISLFFHNTFLQILLLTAIHLLVNLYFLHVCNRNGWYYASFAIGTNFLYFFAGSLLLKESRNAGGRSLRSQLPAVGLAGLSFLFELVFLPRLTGSYAGLFCGLITGTMLLAAFAASLYFAAKALPLDRQNGFLLLFHLSGILTLLLFLSNQLHTLYSDPSEISRLFWGSAGIYAETILLGTVFYFQEINGKGQRRWTHS